MTDGSYRITLTPFIRISSLILIVIEFILFFAALTLLTHYSSMPLPFVPYPSIITATNSTPHYLHNFLLYLLFWVLHIFMATLKYKIPFNRFWKYFPVYERYIYNIVSGLCLWFMCANFMPSNIDPVFSISMYICLPLNMIGTLVYAIAMLSLGHVIMLPYPITKLLNDRELEIKPYNAQRSTILITTGIYGIIRHPIQAGLLLMMVFGGDGQFTVERLIFATTMVVFILIGVSMEEKRLNFLEKGYKKYKEEVKCLYIPYLI